MKSLTVLFLLAAPLLADGVTGGTVNTLLALTPGFGARPAVASSPLGRSIVAWVAFQGAPGSQTLNVAFLDANGNVMVAPSVVSVGTLLPGSVEVAATPAGFLLTFDAIASLGQFERNVYYRFYDTAGNQIAAGQANTISALSAEVPRCAGNAIGDYAIVWVRRDVFASFPNSQDVWVRRFNALGNPVDATEVRVDDPAVGFGGMGGASVGVWPSGRLVVTWHDGSNGATPGPASPDGHGQGVYARWFDATLAPITVPILANATTALDQFEPLVRCDDRNRCLIGWCGDSVAALVDTWVRAFDDQGSALDATDQNLTPTNTASDQFLQSVSGTSNGEWVATWVDTLSTSGEPAPRGGWARLAQNRSVIETGTTSSGGSATQGYMFPKASCDQWGNFILVWQVQSPATGVSSSMGIDYRRFRRNMITLTPPNPTPGTTVSITLDSPSDANNIYVLVPSAGTGPLSIDTRNARLSQDALFDYLVTGGGNNGGIFSNFLGTLGPAGTSAAPSILVPPIPSLSGTTIYLAFATGGGFQLPSGINTISDTTSLTVQ